MLFLRPMVLAIAVCMLVSTSVLANPISGEFDGSQILSKAGWEHKEGAAKEEIIDLGSGNKAYKVSGISGNFFHRLSFGKWSKEDMNQLNQVEIRWANTSPDTAGANGFMVGSVERRLFFFPFATEVNASLEPGMQGPIDTKKVPKYDAKEPNVYRLEWTTAQGGKYQFQFFVNGINLGEYDGYVNSGDLVLDFEARNGEHTIDYIRWGLNGGKMPGLAVEPSGKLTTTWGGMKGNYSFCF